MADDEIAGDSTASRSRGAVRRFEDGEGRWWSVTWRPPHNRSTRVTQCFVFESEDGGATRYLSGAPGDGAARLVRMSIGDLRQLFCMAEALMPQRREIDQP
jgi:hypothetical protein